MSSSTALKKKTRDWWKRVRNVRSWERNVWIVIVLTAIGGFLRFYNISETVMFLGDQGRDAIIVSRMFTQLDPVFIGPVTSVGNMYLGPFYYYFMLPFLWLSYPSPMGPVYAVAALGTLTIPLMYVLGARMLGRRAGLLASVLVTFSAAAISLSRFSWNPNLLPLVGLIWFYCLHQAALGKRWYWVGVAVSIGLLLQLHYITLLAAGVSGLVWIRCVITQYRKGSWRLLVVPTLAGALILGLFQIPLLLFDAKHDWLNVRQFLQLLKGEDAFASDRSEMSRLMQILNQSKSRISQLFVTTTFAQSSIHGAMIGIGSLIALAALSLSEKKREVRLGVGLLLLTLLISVVGLSVYKNDVYLHYLGFLLPVVLLGFAYIFDRVIKIHMVFRLVVAVVLLFYIWTNVSSLSYKKSGPSQAMLAETARVIHEQVSANEPYSVILLSESKDLYGMNYRYFLTTNREKEPLDPELFNTAQKMFVIWEDKKVLEPLQLRLYELLVFNVATPSASFDIPDGPTVLELRKD